MREDKAVALGGAVSGVAAGAAANHVAMGAVNGVGHIAGATAKIVAAGDQGWDENGDFVCSKFIFNFRTKQVFDGALTHELASIANVKTEDAFVVLTITGQAAPRRIYVGVLERAEVVGRMFEAMWSGEEMLPEGKRLKPLDIRRREFTAGTLIRFAGRAVFFGFVLTFFTSLFSGIGPIRLFVLETWAIVIFAGSIAHHAFKGGPLPLWTEKRQDSKWAQRFGYAAIVVTVFYGVTLPYNVTEFRSLNGGYYDQDYAVEACDSYYFYPAFIRVAMPWKWWCDPNRSEVIGYRDAKLREQYKITN